MQDKPIRKLCRTCIGAWMGVAALLAVCLVLDYGGSSGFFGDKTSVLVALVVGSPAGALAMLYPSISRWWQLAFGAVGAVLGLVLGVFLLDAMGGFATVVAIPVIVGVCCHSFGVISVDLRRRSYRSRRAGPG